jgi:hypothetical protein
MKISYDIMRIILAILLLVHGVAHLPGFLVPWRLPASGRRARAPRTRMTAGRHMTISCGVDP